MLELGDLRLRQLQVSVSVRCMVIAEQQDTEHLILAVASGHRAIYIRTCIVVVGSESEQLQRVE